MLYLATMAVFADMYATQPLLPLLSREFHIGAAAAGSSISVVVGGIALGSGLFGPLSDVFGRKRVLVTSAFVLGFATLACAFAPSFGALLFWRALQGLAVPGVSAVAIPYIGDNFSRERTASLVGTYVAFSGLGGLLGRVIAGVLAGRFDWRVPFYAYAAFTLAAAIGMLVVLRHDVPKSHRGTRSIFKAYASMSDHVRHPRLLAAFCIGFLVFFAFIGVFTYLPYLLSGPPYHLGTDVISFFYFSYVAGVIVSPISGRLSRKGGARVVITAGIVIAGAGCAVTLVHAVPLIALGTVVLATGMFTVQSVAPAFVNLTAAHSKGGANSLYQVFYYAGAVFGSTLPGIAWERWAWDGVIVSCGASLVLALAATLGLAGKEESSNRADAIMST